MYCHHALPTTERKENSQIHRQRPCLWTLRYLLRQPIWNCVDDAFDSARGVDSALGVASGFSAWFFYARAA